MLAEQAALPLPSAPLLLAAGALSRTGRMSLAVAVGCCVAGALIADTVWFHLGRRGGTRVLRFLCRASLEPDSCVRRTENAFLKHGMKSLLVSKFVPGLNAVAAPLAGNSGAGFARFLSYDVAGTAVWSGAYLALGYLFSGQLEMVIDYASQLGSWLLAIVAGLFALWIVWKFFQRRRLMRELDIARITPEDLRRRLDAGEDLFIIDLRNLPGEHPPAVTGARHIATEDLANRRQEIPRDREIILFCS